MDTMQREPNRWAEDVAAEFLSRVTLNGSAHAPSEFVPELARALRLAMVTVMSLQDAETFALEAIAGLAQHASMDTVEVLHTRLSAAIAAASALTFGMALVAAHANRITPGDEIAPGLIAMVCGASLVIAGVALIVLVLRMLLKQAVALDSQARQLQSELDEVI